MRNSDEGKTKEQPIEELDAISYLSRFISSDVDICHMANYY